MSDEIEKKVYKIIGDLVTSLNLELGKKFQESDKKIETLNQEIKDLGLRILDLESDRRLSDEEQNGYVQATRACAVLKISLPTFNTRVKPFVLDKTQSQGREFFNLTECGKVLRDWKLKKYEKNSEWMKNVTRRRMNESI